MNVAAMLADLVVKIVQRRRSGRFVADPDDALDAPIRAAVAAGVEDGADGVIDAVAVVGSDADLHVGQQPIKIAAPINALAGGVLSRPRSPAAGRPCGSPSTNSRQTSRAVNCPARARATGSK